jgi:hypothetical protein
VLDGFHFDEHLPIHDEVGAKLPDDLSLESNAQGRFTFHVTTRAFERVAQCPVIDGFEEPRAEPIEDVVERADNDARRLVEMEIRLGHRAIREFGDDADTRFSGGDSCHQAVAGEVVSLQLHTTEITEARGCARIPQRRFPLCRIRVDPLPSVPSVVCSVGCTWGGFTATAYHGDHGNPGMRTDPAEEVSLMQDPC